jgi:hemoglobin
MLSAALIVAAGCHSTTPEKQNREFFTSGSREADQRASQRMAQSEQLSGNGEGSGEKGGKKTSGTNGAAQVSGKTALYDRLGADQGISAIVEDFLPRAMQDPRVNWDRHGVTQGGLSLHAGRSEEWKATPENVAQLKQHLVEFLALATGGPSHYQGKDLKTAHADMHISNPEFDAVVGDLKVSLDRLRIANTEQKELLAIIESTRPEIVTKR